MRLFSTPLFLILIAASPALCLWERNEKTAAVENNYKEVNGFSGYLTLDDYPRDRVRSWFDPVEIATLSAMPTMKRGRTMGAFVELRGCKQNARRVCNARVNFTIYKPDESILSKSEVRQSELLWRKQAPHSPRSHELKSKNSAQERGRNKEGGTDSIQSRGLARMNFKLGKDFPAGDYKVKAEVSDLNANISFELELNFYLR
jgi:hypothetical protein